MKLFAALKLKVNISKTQCMFVTNQRTRLPETITIDGIRIEIKDRVKVLRVTLDNELISLLSSKAPVRSPTIT